MAGKNTSTLSKWLDDLDSVIDRKQKYCSRNCLLFHDIEEESSKNTDQRVIDAC